MCIANIFSVSRLYAPVNAFFSSSVPGRLVIKRWKNVKDQHIKTLRKKERSVATGKKMKNYIYHEQLSFLKVNLDKNEVHLNYKEDPDKSGASDEETDDVPTVEKHRETSEVNVIKTRAMRLAMKRKKIDLEGEMEEHSLSKEDHHMSSIKDLSNSSSNQDHSFSSTQDHLSSSTNDHFFASTKDHTSSSAKQDLPFPSIKEDRRFPTKEDRHLSFFNAIRPSLEQFTDDETLQFQCDVINVIQNIKKARLPQPQISTQHPSSSGRPHTLPHLNGQTLIAQQESGQVSPTPSACGSSDVCY